jgi:hypothetical protein
MGNSIRPWLTPYHWKKGETGNPAGRRASFINVAVHVWHLTRNGAELVALLLAIARGEAIPMPGRNGNRPPQPQRPNLNQRIQVAQLLLDRGWGKPQRLIELLDDKSPEETHKQNLAMLSTLSDEELAQLRVLLVTARDRAQRAGTLGPSPEPTPRDDSPPASPARD